MPHVGGKIAVRFGVVLKVVPSSRSALAAVLKSLARRRLAVAMFSLVAIGILPAITAAAPSGVHLVTVPAASGPWLDRFNTWRANAGVSTLGENSSWSQGDVNHALYMVKNDLVTHYETPGTPYYTTAGDTAARHSNIYVSSSTSTSDVQAIDFWMQAPFHALGMMDPRLTQTGFGSHREVKSGWQMGAAVDVLSGNPFTGGQYPVYFPGNGSTEPLTSYGGGEFPDPLQGPCSGYTAPTGLPVFVQVGGNVATTAGPNHTFTGNGAPLQHCVLDSNSPNIGSNLTYRGGVVLIPRQPLQVGVKYVVALTVNGVPQTWSFTVGSSFTAGTPSLGAVLEGRPLVADFNGDGKADLALVGNGGTSVAVSTGTGFSTPTVWSSVPFYGNRTTLAGDMAGTGKAALVAVNDTSTWVMTSTGNGFGAPAQWSNIAFYGTRGTFIADVNGDGKADLVAVNDTSVWVMLSTGTGFGPPTQWSNTAFYGNVTTMVGDVNGDLKADLIAVNNGSTWVMTSTGSGFNAPTQWINVPFYGNLTTMVADMNGDGKADLLAVNSGSVWVMTSTGTGFGPPTQWSGTPFYGLYGTVSGDVTGDRKADLIAINNTSVWVVVSTGTGLSAPQMWL